MDFQAEVLKAVKEGNASLETFKNMTIERINFLESVSAKANRPHLGGMRIADDFSEAATAHKTAFSGFLRKGEITGLADLQQKSMSVGSGPDGGYAVPKVIDSMINDLAVNISPIRAIARVQQISTPDFHTLVNARGTGSSWVGENTARPGTNTPQLKDIAPPMGELYSNLSATQQMLDDSFFNAEEWLAEQASTEFGRAEGAAFISGNGVNQPLGFLSGPAPVATADATRAFGTLQYVGTGASGAFKTLTSTVNPIDDFYVLVASLKAAYRKGASFVMNKKTLFAVMGMKDYQGRYVFNPATAPGMQDTLLGYPIYEAEDMPDYTAANAFGVAFGNFQQGYIIVDRIGTRVLRDPFSDKPRVSFYITKRLGGTVLNSEAIKLMKFA
jgi:HK97 family phage major capsid protein